MGKEGDGEAEAENETHSERKTGEEMKLGEGHLLPFQYPQGPLSHLLFYPSACLTLPELCLDYSETARAFYYSRLVI